MISIQGYCKCYLYGAADYPLNRWTGEVGELDLRARRSARQSARRSARSGDKFRFTVMQEKTGQGNWHWVANGTPPASRRRQTELGAGGLLFFGHAHFLNPVPELGIRFCIMKGAF